MRHHNFTLKIAVPPSLSIDVLEACLYEAGCDDALLGSGKAGQLVRSGGKEAKFWLTPEVAVARNEGFDARTIRVLLEVVEQNRNMFEDAWHDYFA